MEDSKSEEHSSVDVNGELDEVKEFDRPAKERISDINVYSGRDNVPISGARLTEK